ncbi:hypothetical protein POM88_039002 [Heracleum sosnowskyi]|uniref:Uncharacterized protein n=1 Tax=Heracleum sosnowskyi TaxID=360622 RepID=A0AAD8HAM7_9APIA|nr:hypothetical protein POM88_039002 [Heracleum sosnowskyi]
MIEMEFSSSLDVIPSPRIGEHAPNHPTDKEGRHISLPHPNDYGPTLESRIGEEPTPPLNSGVPKKHHAQDDPVNIVTASTTAGVPTSEEEVNSEDKYSSPESSPQPYLLPKVEDFELDVDWFTYDENTNPQRKRRE